MHEGRWFPAPASTEARCATPWNERGEQFVPDPFGHLGGGEARPRYRGVDGQVQCARYGPGCLSPQQIADVESLPPWRLTSPFTAATVRFAALGRITAMCSRRSRMLKPPVNIEFTGGFTGGRCRIRTYVGDADGFTDRSLWPLGQPAVVGPRTKIATLGRGGPIRDT